MRSSLSLPSLTSPKLFSSEDQLETARSELKVRITPNKEPNLDQPRISRSLIHFQEGNQGFSSFRSINTSKMGQILDSLKGMRANKSNIGQSIKAEILFNQKQYSKIQDYCKKRNKEEKEIILNRLAKLEPLPMKKQIKKTLKNRQKIKTAVGIKISLNFQIYQQNRLSWKPFIDFDSMPVSINSRVYFIGGRSCSPLTYYDRQNNQWNQQVPIETLLPFGESEGTVISDSEILFFGGSRFFKMGESVVSNSLSFVDIKQKKARVQQFEKEKVVGRCFHGQCLYGQFLIVSGGVDSRHKLLNSFSAYHLRKKYWFQLTIDKMDLSLQLGFAKHKMMTVMYPRKQYNIYEDSPLLSSQEQSTISNEGIYLFGGEDHNVELSNRLHILKIGQPILEVIEPTIQGSPPKPRKNFAWIRIKQNIFIHGGRNDQIRPWVLGEVSVLNLKQMNWLMVRGDKPSMRHSHTLLLNGDEIVILGGKNMQGLCKDVYPIKYEEIFEYL